MRTHPFLLSVAASALLGLSGCTDANPAFCPPDDPRCSGGDSGGGPADLAAPDAAVPADLTPPEPDLASACHEGSDCASEVCLPTGACAGADDVLYVDNAGGACMGAHMGSQADPFCTIFEAIQEVKRGAHHLVHVAGSDARYDYLQLDGIEVSIYGPGGYATPAARIEGGFLFGITYAAAEVTGSSRVLLDGLELASAATDLVTCGSTTGPVPTLTLRRSRVHLGGGAGVSARRCQVTLDRTVVGRNNRDGIDAGPDTQLTLRNSIVALNRLAAISAPLARLRVRFSTIADNGAGIDCGPAGTPDRLIEGSIVVQNGGLGPVRQLSDGCRLVSSATDEPVWNNGGDNRLSAQPDFVMDSLYHLDRTEGSARCCIDQLDRAVGADVREDYEGAPRPQGPRWDIGAFEVP